MNSEPLISTTALPPALPLPNNNNNTNTISIVGITVGSFVKRLPADMFVSGQGQGDHWQPTLLQHNPNSAQQQSPAIFYKITCTATQNTTGNVQIESFRRFSDFVRLDKIIKTKVNNTPAKLPSKIFGTDPTNRKPLLEDYLNTSICFAIDTTCNDDIKILHFLGGFLADGGVLSGGCINRPGTLQGAIKGQQVAALISNNTDDAKSNNDNSVPDSDSADNDNDSTTNDGNDATTNAAAADESQNNDNNAPDLADNDSNTLLIAAGDSNSDDDSNTTNLNSAIHINNNNGEHTNETKNENNNNNADEDKVHSTPPPTNGCCLVM